MTRLYDATLIALGMAFWFGRQLGPGITPKSLIWAVVISGLLVGLVHERANVQGAETTLGWTLVGLCFILAIWAILVTAQS